MDAGIPHRFLESLSLPALRHAELEPIFYTEFDLGAEYLGRVLSLPRESLVADLVDVLEFGAEHSDEFVGALNAGKIGFAGLSFPIHALFMLAELGAEERLDEVLGLMRRPGLAEFFDVQGVDSELWWAFYGLGRKAPQALVAFMEEGAPLIFGPGVVDALVQLALHEPVWRDQVVEWFSRMLETSLDQMDGENLMATLLVMGLRDLRAVSAIPLIRRAFEADQAIPSLCGSLQEVEKKLNASHYEFTKVEIKDLVGVYKGMENYDSIGLEGDEEGEAMLDLGPRRPVKPGTEKSGRSVRAKSQGQFGKVGRNDPCPCGSGKKYKKCHGR